MPETRAMSPQPQAIGHYRITGTLGKGWSRQGEELFHLEYGIPRNRLMTAPVRSGSHGEFRAGTPNCLSLQAGWLCLKPTSSSIAPARMGGAFW
jgi:hypothetical protein